MKRARRARRASIGRRTRPLPRRAVSTTPSPNARASSSTVWRFDWLCGGARGDYAQGEAAGCPPMPIMAARLYNQGKPVRDIGPNEAAPDRCAEGDFFWLGL